MIYKFYEVGKKVRDIVADKPLPLEELQKLVGGYIEFAPLNNGHTICVNEEGIIKNLPINFAIKQEDTPVDIDLGLRGNIIEGRVDDEGEFIGVE